MATSYTYHGAKRIVQRIALEPKGLSAILDNSLWVHVGEEENTDREHCLFFSPYDDLCFVAIRDKKTHHIITVLPLDYHKNIAWEITEDQVLEARKFRQGIYKIIDQTFTRHSDRQKAANHKDNENTGNVATIKLTASCLREDGSLKTVSLGSLPPEDFGYEIEKAARNPLLKHHVSKKIGDKGYEFEDIYSIFMRLGKKGASSLILVGDLDW